MILFDKISIELGSRTLWQDFSFRVPAGERWVVTGPSGCGKSTLLRAVAGLMPFTGTIKVNGLELSAENRQQIRAMVAIIGQEPVVSGASVLAALKEPFSYKAHLGNYPGDEVVKEWLKRFHLSETILSTEPGRLSGGEKQRLAIIRALLLDKRIFLMDEVTSALDPASKAAVLDVVRQNPQMTVLSVSHDPDWITICEELRWNDGQAAPVEVIG